MPTLKEIKENLETISTIKNIVRAYQEIANLRMKLIREKVLKNREFFKKLSDTYQRIKSAYLFSLKKGWVRKRKTSFLQPKKKSVVIFLSANKFFYGTLILDIWQKIQEYLKEKGADLAVVGRIGKYLAERGGFGHKMFYFELDDEKPETERIEAIIEFVKNYKEIIVFQGRYETVLSQSVVMSKISGGLPLKEKVEKVKTYLFEPSAEAVLEFFEREIIATLFNQTILEHQLARYASRVIAMYQATENAKNLEKKLKLIENKLARQRLNKRQTEFFGSVKL